MTLPQTLIVPPFRFDLTNRRLWHQQGKQKRARQRLAEIFGWFSEGGDTTDLREAKALLSAWS